jgi:hypothetical protein
MKGITKKNFFDFGSLLTEISQKSFLDIQWKTLGCNLAPHGAIWRHMAPSGAMWRHHKVPYGATWRHLAPYGA